MVVGSNFEVRTRICGRTAIVVLRGEVDLATAPQVRTAVLDALEHAVSNVFLDLRELTYADNALLHVLEDLERDARVGAVDLRIVRPVGAVQRLFEVTGFDDRFVFVDEPV
jgi:anti-sigma B factor antagonist